MFIDFRERERWGEGERHQLPPIHALTGDQTCNLGMCPDWELNPQHFGVQGNASTN